MFFYLTEYFISDPIWYLFIGPKVPGIAHGCTKNQILNRSTEENASKIIYWKMHPIQAWGTLSCKTMTNLSMHFDPWRGD